MKTQVTSVGPNAPGATPSSPLRLDDYAAAQVAIQVVVTGTVNYTVQQTLDDPNSSQFPVAQASMTWFPLGDASGVGATANMQSKYDAAPCWVRVLLNSGTGTVRLTVKQSGGIGS